MIDRNKLAQILKGSKEKSDRPTPKIDKILEMLENHPEQLTMGIILEELGSSALQENEKLSCKDKLLSIPIV